MSPVEIGMLSVLAIVVLVYMGLYIPIALGLVSFISVWIMSGKSILAFNFLKIAVGDGVTEYNFATIPLFTLMGLLVSKAGLGRDIYDVMNSAFRKVLAGIGMATVGANAIFAAITGSSIASASVFTKISVPEMLRYNYNKRFAVGVVAGSSVLGMIIPPSAMLIIYSFISEQSVGEMFLAGIVPGLILTASYIMAIFAMARLWPTFIGENIRVDTMPALSASKMVHKAWPVVALIVLVLGGIYTGWLTPVEAGAAGASLALIVAAFRRSMSWKGFWSTLVETGHITAAILLLITNELDALLQTWDLSFFKIMLIYVAMMLVLGTLLDTASIILIVVPLFITLIEGMGLSLVWFGIVTVIGAEIGLLTPPLGISCFVIKSTLNNPDITLKDVFLGSLPFAIIMLLVLILLIKFPILSTVLL